MVDHWLSVLDRVRLVLRVHTRRVETRKRNRSIGFDHGAHRQEARSLDHRHAKVVGIRVDLQNRNFEYESLTKLLADDSIFADMPDQEESH
jgi:hypothetical protein